MYILLATRNSKKRKEIAEVLSIPGIELGDLAERDVPDVEETGTSFEENARLKAVQVAQATSCWTLGEDSGLVVPALQGQPGIYSARFAGPHGDDAANNAKLLSELSSFPDDRRAAYYVTVAVLANPQGTVHATVEGRCHGVILREPRGTGGFGYDPLFCVPELHKTFGELSPRVKQALSHRARALERLIPELRKLATDEHR